VREQLQMSSENEDQGNDEPAEVDDDAASWTSRISLDNDGYPTQTEDVPNRDFVKFSYDEEDIFVPKMEYSTVTTASVEDTSQLESEKQDSKFVEGTFIIRKDRPKHKLYQNTDGSLLSDTKAKIEARKQAFKYPPSSTAGGAAVASTSGPKTAVVLRDRILDYRMTAFDEFLNGNTGFAEGRGKRHVPARPLTTASGSSKQESSSAFSGALKQQDTGKVMNSTVPVQAVHLDVKKPASSSSASSNTQRDSDEMIFKLPPSVYSKNSEGDNSDCIADALEELDRYLEELQPGWAKK
jgi:hypothetical protein